MAGSYHLVMVSADLTLEHQLSAFADSGIEISLQADLEQALAMLDGKPTDGLVFDMALMEDQTFLGLVPFREHWPLMPLVLLCHSVDFFHFPEILAPFAVIYKDHQRHRFPACLLQTFAGIDGQIESAGEQEPRQDRRLVADLVRLLSAEKPLSTVLQLLADITGARGGSLFRFRQTELVLEACLDPGHAPGSIRMPLDEKKPFGMAYAQQKPLLLDTSHDRGLHQSGWSGYNDGSMIVLPLMNQHNHIHGLISLHNKQEPPFDEQDFKAGRQLATLAARLLLLDAS